MSVTRFMCVFVWNLIITSAKNCGTVHLTYNGTSDGVDAILKLFPSKDINITEYKFRWYMHFYESSGTQLFKTSVAKVEPLTVHNIEPGDFGKYSLDCWKIGKQDTPILSNNEVLIDNSSLQVPSAQMIPTDPHNNTKALPLNNSIVIIVVVILCTAIIIIAAITVIIKLKKRRLSADKRIVTSWQSRISDIDFSAETSHVYEEIEDVDDSHNHRMIGNTCTELGVFDYTYVNEVAIQQNTYPPDRDNDCRNGSTRILPALGSDNTYQSIGTATSGSVYATVAPKSHRSKLHTDIPNRKCGSTFTVSTGVRDEYANVLPRSQRIKLLNNETNNNVSDYTVDVLNETERAPKSRKFEMVKTVPENGYITPVFVPCHEDGTGALVYVDVDHGECGVDLANQYDLAINMSSDTPCTYSTIDINKKAFIAPIRRAPSSWYKRKQNRTGKC